MSRGDSQGIKNGGRRISIGDTGGVQACNKFLRSLGDAGKIDDAVVAYEAMLRSGVRPTIVTFSTLISRLALWIIDIVLVLDGMEAFIVPTIRRPSRHGTLHQVDALERGGGERGGRGLYHPVLPSNHAFNNECYLTYRGSGPIFPRRSFFIYL